MDMNAIQSICTTIADYRQGSVSPRAPQDVTLWANQIAPPFRDALVAELAHVLRSTYLSRNTVLVFLKGLIHNSKLNGGNALQFWSQAGLLQIQQRGNSQREMLSEFSALLQAELGVPGRVEPSDSGVFIYLDDAIFTGNHVRRDLENWIATQAPSNADVHIIVAARHQGSWWIEKKADEAARAAGKALRFHWWHCLMIEDRKKYIDSSDVLRPRDTAFSPLVQQYADSLDQDVILRAADSCGSQGIFSGETGRSALELGLLEAGCRAKQQCTYLADNMRPLGYHYFPTLGFGATVITYRNIPNNCPIALWAGDPWLPLFPRKTNEPTFDWGLI